MAVSIDDIRGMYVIKDEEEYSEFIADNPGLPPILIDISKQIPGYFKDIQRMDLVVRHDPEIPGLSNLCIFIRVRDRGEHNRKQYIKLVSDLPALAPGIKNLLVFI